MKRFKKVLAVMLVLTILGVTFNGNVGFAKVTNYRLNVIISEIFVKATNETLHNVKMYPYPAGFYEKDVERSGVEGYKYLALQMRHKDRYNGFAPWIPSIDWTLKAWYFRVKVYTPNGVKWVLVPTNVKRLYMYIYATHSTQTTEGINMVPLNKFKAQVETGQSQFGDGCYTREVYLFGCRKASERNKCRYWLCDSDLKKADLNLCDVYLGPDDSGANEGAGGGGY